MGYSVVVHIIEELRVSEPFSFWYKVYYKKVIIKLRNIEFGHIEFYSQAHRLYVVIVSLTLVLSFWAIVYNTTNQ
jgi:hypothetical protein